MARRRRTLHRRQRGCLPLQLLCSTLLRAKTLPATRTARTRTRTVPAPCMCRQRGSARGAGPAPIRPAHWSAGEVHAVVGTVAHKIPAPKRRCVQRVGNMRTAAYACMGCCRGADGERPIVRACIAVGRPAVSVCPDRS
jgi:hypothetical protein